MNVPRLILALALGGPGVAVTGRAAEGPPERERNAWPVVVRERDAAGGVTSWTGAGPLLFRQPTVDGGQVAGFRPLYLRVQDAAGDFRAAYFLYPLFSYHQDADTYRWSLLELIRRTNRRAAAGAPRSVFDERGEFEVWPFWFSRQTGDPAMSYHGLFPVAGTIRNMLGFERASWVLFPLYAQTEKRGAVTTSVPWPFVRITRGTAHGFGLWPLFSTLVRDDGGRDDFYLWPLGYNHVKPPAPDAPPGTPPRHDVGALPFYAASTGPGYADVNYLWPFFGVTDQTAPVRYHETRYFWPFLVQGRGDERRVNRWGPVYTHSITKGYDKTWYLWPLVRRAQWTEAEHDLVHERTQLFYFLYWSEVQHSASRPQAPAAHLTHVWPLFSSWDNGAGRRQWQALSPFEVFFSGNEKWRQTWSPFFTLVRHEQRAPGDERTELLWNAVTWERHDAAAEREFHLGPLLSVTRRADEKRVAIGNGLLGFAHPAGGGWGMFWLDFRPKSATTSASR